MMCFEGAHKLPAQLDEELSAKIHLCDNTNEIIQTHDGIFINALHENMPECNLKRGNNKLSDIREGDMCHVYCAQSSCAAAIQYMNENKEQFLKCDVIHYIHQGAINMHEKHLSKGDECHLKIKAYNES